VDRYKQNQEISEVNFELMNYLSIFLGLSPDALNGKQGSSMAQTSTTFSLPYYHAIYSHSQPSSSPEGKKVHAPTFTPEIGTLPSVVSVATLPVQTTACDMRIKKEKISYTCCKEKCVTVVTSNTNTVVASQQSCTSPTTEKSESTQRPTKKINNDTKDGKVKKINVKTPDSSKGDTETSVASIKPVVSNTNKIAVHPVNSSGSNNKQCKVLGTASVSTKTQEISNYDVDDKAEKEGTVRNIVHVKCKKSDKQDGIKQNVTSHKDHALTKGTTIGDIKVPAIGESVKNNDLEKINVVSVKSNISDKKDRKSSKLESNVVTLVATDSVLHKKSNDMKSSSRKMKVMSPQRDVHLSKSSDFKHVTQSKLHEKSIRPREVKKGDAHNKEEHLTTGK